MVFADSRGLALAAIYVFNKAEDNSLGELQFHLTEIEGATAGLQLGDKGEDSSVNWFGPIGTQILEGSAVVHSESRSGGGDHLCEVMFGDGGGPGFM